MAVTIPKTLHLLWTIRPEYKSVSQNKQRTWWTLDLMPSPWSSLCWSP
jgi:hypothetical protein